MVLLVAARLVPQLISPLAFWLLFAALVCASGVDFLLWFTRGVRAIELNGDVLTLRRGRTRTVQRIERASVRSMRSGRSWGGRVIQIRIRQAGSPGAGRPVGYLIPRLLSRLLGRDRVLLRDDAFDREAFASLATLLTGWNHRGG